MTDLAISWSVAAATIAFLVIAGWRNHRAAIRKGSSAAIDPPLRARDFRPVVPAPAVLSRAPQAEGVSISQQLIRFNAALVAESMSLAAGRTLRE